MTLVVDNSTKTLTQKLKNGTFHWQMSKCLTMHNPSGKRHLGYFT